VSVGDVLTSVAATKKAKYDDVAAGMEAKFVPLVLSAFGHFPKETNSFFRLETATGVEHILHRWPGGPKAFIKSFQASVSCAVQKRNAFIYARALQLIRAKDRRGPEPVVP
jgi:hypothetical protein